MRPPTLSSPMVLGLRQPHGVRLRYMSGCRCLLCRAANSRYETERAAERRAGGWNGLIPAGAVRRKLLQLSRVGVGRRAVQRATGVSETTQCLLRRKRRTRIRAQSARRILDLTASNALQGAYVPAAPTWVRIRQLLRQGFTKAELARRLGYKRPALQFRPGRVTARNARRILRLYNSVM